jgi:branched-chain amino acid transport system ATP-binding protein
MLAVADMTVTYRGVVGVSGVDLDLAEGEVLALLGPNGAGKSSLLRGIVGSSATTGRITFEGRDITKWPTHRRARGGIMQVPQGGRLFAELTVEENLHLGAYGAKPKERATRLVRVLDFFPRIKERRGQRADSLSGGEQQMLAIGRALMSEPRLVLLDEPSLGLAPLMVSEMFEHIARLRSFGVAIVIVDQNAVQAMAIADSVCVLERGRRVYGGSVEEANRDLELVSAHLGLGIESQALVDPPDGVPSAGETGPAGPHDGPEPSPDARRATTTDGLVEVPPCA